MKPEPNPYLEVLERQGPDALIAALKADPMQTTALKAAIHALTVFASIPFGSGL